MPIELVNLYLALPLFLLVAGRLAGVVMFLPMIGGMSVPPRVRAMLVIGLAALLTPMLAADWQSRQLAAPTEPLAMAEALGSELLVGVLIGLVVRICFDGLQAGAQLIAQESGMAFGQIVDPNSGVEADMLSVFYMQLAGVVFLIIGGHRVLVSAAMDSFGDVPPLAGAFSLADGMDAMVAALAAGSELALKIAAPVIVTLLLVNVALGFISRTVPQLNVATVGFSVKGLLAFVLMAVALPVGIEAFVDTLESVVGHVLGG